MISHAPRGWRSVIAEGAALLATVAAAWFGGRIATDAWVDRVSTMEGLSVPPIELVHDAASSATIYFAIGAALLLTGRVAGTLRARHPMRVPFVVPAMAIACAVGLLIHHATVEIVVGVDGGRVVPMPTAAPFAQGFMLGCVVAAAILAAPFDLVGLAGRLTVPIALTILAVFVALAVAGTGPGTSGARINLGPIQPIEAVKPLFVVFLAAYLGARASKLRWQRERVLGLVWPRPVLLLPAVGALVAIFAGLYVVGDLGPLVILAMIFLAMFYAATRAGGWAILSIAIVGGLLAVAVTWPELVEIARVATRIRMWKDPWWNAIPHGDQLGESLWAIASGGGLGQGLARAYAPLVPAGKTDLVLATLVEQIGLVGLLTYLVALAAIVGGGLYVSTRARTPERSLLAAGASVLLLVQWATIHAGTFGLLPLTGVVVPFLSTGRSSMVAFVATVALIARVADDGRARTEGAELTELHRSGRWLAIAAAALLVAGGAAALRVAVIDRDVVSASGIETVLADGTRVNRANPRLVSLAARVRRGTIEDRHGRPLAVTEEPGTPRRYPLGEAMGTLLGAHPSRVLLPSWALERTFETRLRGYGRRADGPSERPRPDLRRFVPLLELDHREREAHIRAMDADVASRSVRLSIDGRLQREVASALRRHVASGDGLAAAAVVIDVDTGSVLARAQVPDFDPADASWQSRLSEGDDRRFVGAYGEWPDKTGVQGIFQSGSVGKLFTSLAAAREGEEGLVFSCVERDADGPLFTRPDWSRPIHDHPRDRTHGRVDLVEALAVSCNVYFGQLALELGPQPFLSLLRAGAEVGYGAAVPFDPGAEGSRQLASTGFGQGALALNVSQAARLVAAVGAGGRYRRCPPTLEQVDRCPEVLLVDDPSTVEPILRGMRRVMTHGTGRSLDPPENLRLYGKTGTADVRGFAGEEAFGIEPGSAAPPHSWFVALAEPTGAPEASPTAPGRVAIAVVVPRGGSGASAAGPLAMEIAGAADALGYIGHERSSGDGRP